MKPLFCVHSVTLLIYHQWLLLKYLNKPLHQPTSFISLVQWSLSGLRGHHTIIRIIKQQRPDDTMFKEELPFSQEL